MADSTSGVKAGQEILGKPFTMTLEKMCLFSAWPGMERYGLDPVNHHTSVEVARQLGRPAPIVPGLQLSSYIEELLIQAFGTFWLTSGKLGVSYLGVVVAGDTVQPKARVVGFFDEQGGTGVKLEVSVENERGSVVVAGTASLVL
ncbi:MAG: MaoC family dehydratase [Chloroflexi bacterium]|nr:MaoC family dehydratase [Chloroflexota bacterium]